MAESLRIIGRRGRGSDEGGQHSWQREAVIKSEVLKGLGPVGDPLGSSVTVTVTVPGTSPGREDGERALAGGEAPEGWISLDCAGRASPVVLRIRALCLWFLNT